MHVIVIGAGVIGAALAFRLARQGADVLVLERGQGPAVAATGASFGWINASFFHTPHHHDLRRAGIDAWHRLAQAARLDGALSWRGALWWEAPDPEMTRMQEALEGFGYDVARWPRGGRPAVPGAARSSSGMAMDACATSVEP